MIYDANLPNRANGTIVSRFFTNFATVLAVILIPACATTPKTETVGKVKLLNITLIWLREPGNDANRQQVIRAAHRFAREIPEIQRLSVGPPFPYGGPGLDSSFDICLVVQFDDEDALYRYTKHPSFQKAESEVLLPLTRQVKVYNVVSE